MYNESNSNFARNTLCIMKTVAALGSPSLPTRHLGQGTLLITPCYMTYTSLTERTYVSLVHHIFLSFNSIVTCNYTLDLIYTSCHERCLDRDLLNILQSILDYLNEISVTTNLQSTVVSPWHYTGDTFSRASLSLQDIAVHASH